MKKSIALIVLIFAGIIGQSVYAQCAHPRRKAVKVARVHHKIHRHHRAKAAVIHAHAPVKPIVVIRP